MIIEVDTASPVPAYEQIRAQFATLIENGALQAGTALPTIRQLAADLGLAVNTVARAYRELESAGLVLSRVRHGTVVAPREVVSPAELRRRLNVAAKHYADTARQLGFSAEEAAQALSEALSTEIARPTR